jgi:hypothetical protein
MRQTSHSTERGCCADAATGLGIPPPSSVRVTIGDYSHDWPWEWVCVCRDRLELRDPDGSWPAVVNIPFDRATRLDSGVWVLHREQDILVTPTPPGAARR